MQIFPISPDIYRKKFWIQVKVFWPNYDKASLNIHFFEEVCKFDIASTKNRLNCFRIRFFRRVVTGSVGRILTPLFFYLDTELISGVLGHLLTIEGQDGLRVTLDPGYLHLEPKLWIRIRVLWSNTNLYWDSPLPGFKILL